MYIFRKCGTKFIYICFYLLSSLYYILTIVSPPSSPPGPNPQPLLSHRPPLLFSFPSQKQQAFQGYQANVVNQV